MTTTTLLATQTYTAGTTNLPATDIGDDVTTLQFDVLRDTSADTSIWPNSTDTISYDLKISVGGGTPVDWKAGSDTGGIHTNKHGVEYPTMSDGGSIPSGTGRQLQGTLTFSADIKTGASVTMT